VTDPGLDGLKENLPDEEQPRSRFLDEYKGNR